MKSKTVIIGDYAYDTKDTQKGVMYKDIKIPKGAELWEPEEPVKFYKDKKLRKKLNLSDCWFFVQSKYYLPESVARFGANSGGSILGCGGGEASSLGVRFKRKVKK